MTRDLIFSPAAERDLDEILCYVARDKPGAAVQFVQALQIAAKRSAAILFLARTVASCGRDCGESLIADT